MKVTSAFFAEAVGIYEGKLFVQGGVWSWYQIPAAEIPASPPVALAAIAQVSAEDRGQAHHLRVRMIRPDGSEGPVSVVPIDVPADPGEHVPMAMGYGLEITTHGRHVLLLDMDEDEQNAFALPIEVREPR